MEQQKSLLVAMAQNKGNLILEQIRILYTQNNVTAKRITSKCQVIIGYDYVIIPKRMNTNNILHLNEAALCDNNCLNEEQNLITYEKNPELFINLHANSVLKDSKEVLNCWKPKYILNTIEDIFNDKLNYEYITLDQIIILNQQMYQVAQKYKLFGGTDLALEALELFQKNFGVIRDELLALENDLMDAKNYEHSLKTEAAALSIEISAVEQKIKLFSEKCQAISLRGCNARQIQSELQVPLSCTDNDLLRPPETSNSKDAQQKRRVIKKRTENPEKGISTNAQLSVAPTEWPTFSFGTSSTTPTLGTIFGSSPLPSNDSIPPLPPILKTEYPRHTFAWTTHCDLVTSPFKVVIVGDGGVGKTSYLWRFTKRDFTPMYIPTIQVDIFSLKFNTNRGEVLFDVWDVAGQPKRSGHGASVIGINACIIMFDLTSRMSYKTVHYWYQELIKNVKEEEIASLPMVLIGNKTDVKERQVKDRTITFHKNKTIEYFELSVKKEINCKEPWLALARKLMKDNTLDFVN